MDAEALSRWVRERRREARLSQQELAERAGCSKSYISTLERGSRHSGSGGVVRPSEVFIDNLARGLGVPRDEARLQAGYAPARGAEAPPAQPPDPLLRAGAELRTVYLEMLEIFERLPTGTPRTAFLRALGGQLDFAHSMLREIDPRPEPPAPERDQA